MWETLSKEEIKDSINLFNILSKTYRCDNNLDGLLEYAIRAHILEETRPNHYALQKDWTPLGLIYRPLIKSLRQLFIAARKDGKYTSAFTSQAIAENINQHYRLASNLIPNLLPHGILSTSDYIESARNDLIVDVEIKSDTSLAYVSLCRNWQRPQFGSSERT
ncbi:hypothetical protein DFH28DRAFT_1080985 [Melampsora americana]|nr:hypothetical protein DFH28DRAFT_1080985 [Melampsora americana]